MYHLQWSKGIRIVSIERTQTFGIVRLHCFKYTPLTLSSSINSLPSNSLYICTFKSNVPMCKELVSNSLSICTCKCKVHMCDELIDRLVHRKQFVIRVKRLNGWFRREFGFAKTVPSIRSFVDCVRRRTSRNKKQII